MSDRFDLDHFLALPRLSGLSLSPEGSRLAVTVSGPAPDGRSMRSAIWGVDPAGAHAPVRLTRSGPGESSGAFARDGSLLFTSARPDPDRSPDDKPDTEPMGLWSLPATGGEASLLVAPGGGVESFRVARDADVIVFRAPVHPGTTDLDHDRTREAERSKAGVSARLYEGYPIRFWDHYLGPREWHLFLLDRGSAAEDGNGERGNGERGASSPVDLTPDAGRALDETAFEVLPDGSGIVTGWVRWPDLVHPTQDLVLIDAATRSRRELTADGAWYHDPRVSPDGRWVVAVRDERSTPEVGPDSTLWLVDLTQGTGRDLTPDLDLWPEHPQWSADGRQVLFTADRSGHHALLSVTIEDGEVSVLDAEGAWGDVAVATDASRLFALRSSYAAAPEVVELSLPGRQVRVVRSPGPTAEQLRLPGLPVRVSTTLSDGTTVGSWLIMPGGASAERPAPAVLWIHGGPLSSWNSWHWRWNPHLLVDRGYAVILPDPGLSTGYGRDFVHRGWGRWGEEPYTDLMAVMDAVVARPDIDASRTAAMGGSFGGYMANWVAGHTERFRAIVTHASLWEMRGFHGATDWGTTMEAEFGDPYRDPGPWDAASPDAHVGNIRTPMLVIHGELDHRVPISEGLRLWTDLARHGVDAKFLYFPDENHWILKPANARLWYETVLAYLDHHVLGLAWVRPALL
jgi:dipeptidyl aminopeptidase/acylaminoacyl peptidase